MMVGASQNSKKMEFILEIVNDSVNQMIYLSN